VKKGKGPGKGGQEGEGPRGCPPAGESLLKKGLQRVKRSRGMIFS